MTQIEISDHTAEQLRQLAASRSQSVDALLRDFLAAAPEGRKKPEQSVAEQRLRQQKAIAQLGHRALSNPDLDNLLEVALDLVCEELQAVYAKILVYAPGRRRLRLKAGRGWQAGYVGSYQISEEDDSIAMYALGQNVPVVVENLAEDARFRGAGILHEHDIISSMIVVINGVEHPYGVLCVHDQEPRHFSDTEIHFFQAIANVLAGAVERFGYEARLTYQARLLAEVHDALIATDTDFVITAWNHAAEKLYGWDATEAIGSRVSEIIRSGFTQEQREQAIWLLHQGEVFTVEMLQYHRDGTGFFVEGKTIALYDSYGNVSGYMAINRDITSRKQLENALKIRAAQAEAASEISRLISDVGLDYQAVLDVVVRQITEVIGDMCVITELSADGQWLIPVAFYHSDPAVLEVLTQIYSAASQPVEGVIASVVQNKQPLFLPDIDHEQAESIVTEEFKPYLETSAMHGLIVVPLVAQGQVIGTIGVSRVTSGHKYSTLDLEFLNTLAAQVGVGIQNAKFHSDVLNNRDKLQLLTREIVRVQEDERKHLSRELHDETAQALTVLKYHLEQLSTIQDLVHLEDKVSDLITLTDDTMQSIHALAEHLRPPELDTLGLVSTLREFCEEFAKRSHLQIKFSADNIPSLSDEIDITFYRLLQEALTNVARHAQASQVTVSLASLHERVVLKVEDNGIGFDSHGLQKTTSGTHMLGILGMQERLDRLSGILSIRSEPDAGTQVRAEIALDQRP